MDRSVIFALGIILGAGMMLFADRTILASTNREIAELEEKVKAVPVVTVDALGICKVAQGGKSYMLIDVTDEMKAFDATDQSIRGE